MEQIAVIITVIQAVQSVFNQGQKVFSSMAQFQISQCRLGIRHTSAQKGPVTLFCAWNCRESNHYEVRLHCYIPDREASRAFFVLNMFITNMRQFFVTYLQINVPIKQARRTHLHLCTIFQKQV